MGGWRAVTALLYWLPVGVQLLKAALSCRVAVGAGSSCRGGSSEVEAPLSGLIFLLLLLLSLLLFLLFLQLTSLLLLPSRGTLLFSSSPQVWPEKVVAGFGEMRAAAAAPWWRPGPCAL